MFDVRTNLSGQVLAEVNKVFGDKVFKTVIPRNVRLSEAPSFGKPVILYQPSSVGAESYKQLAKEMISHG
jgi:chromosome partitioning protein